VEQDSQRLTPRPFPPQTPLATCSTQVVLCKKTITSMAAQAPDKYMHSGHGGVRGQILVARSRGAADLARRPGRSARGVKRQSVANCYRRCLYGVWKTPKCTRSCVSPSGPTLEDFAWPILSDVMLWRASRVHLTGRIETGAKKRTHHGLAPPQWGRHGRARLATRGSLAARGSALLMMQYQIVTAHALQKLEDMVNTELRHDWQVTDG